MDTTTTDGVKHSRRQFLKAGLAAGAGLVALAAADAAFFEPHGLQVTHHDIPVAGLHPAFDGFRIALLTDLHHGPVIGLDFVAHAVDLANEQAADLVALAGDYVSRMQTCIAPVFRELSRLKSPHQPVGVMGNHDLWTNYNLSVREMERAGIRYLKNRGVLLSAGGGRLCVAGVADLWTDVPNLTSALEGAPPDVPRIVLAHNPDFAEEMPEGQRVDLMLSGHTHGGQINLPFVGAPFLPSYYGQKYREGLVRGPRCRVYVSRGIGMIRPPVRFNCRPEIPVFTLRREA
jgi:hypothetical protein